MVDQQHDSLRPTGIGRRSLLRGVAGLTGGAAILSTTQAEATPVSTAANLTGDTVRAGRGLARASTRQGEVEGYVSGDIFTFKGVPYADETGGEHRFLPPRTPKPWTGVRSARSYGPVAPQDKGTGRLNDEESFVFNWNDSVVSEDCLRLNVWTPGLDAERRPVVVWLHGGGFAAGSGHDLPAFDGENLARRGDVVVVTLNHRLNLLGFLDLSAYGERYARSANVGMLDIVAALEWIRDNIHAFGGDPGRVTVFGQSGGGAKVSVLMGMPRAKGLFHRAIVMSGSFGMANTRATSQRLAASLLRELGLTDDELDRLQSLPYARLRAAADAVLARENRPFPGFVDVRPANMRVDFAPTVDGDDLPDMPFRPNAPSLSAGVPMMIGSTLNEFAHGINHPDIEAMGETELMSRVEQFAPGQSARIVAAFRATTPDASPFDLWSRIVSAPVRQAAVDQAAAKASAGSAPAYLYWFTWRTPILDGRPRAFHCLDIPFIFANTDRCATMTGGGARARDLSLKMTDAFLAFARNGNPNTASGVAWPAFQPARARGMIFDDTCRVEPLSDASERASLA